ncbi:MAG: hypothetical protein Tsb0034_13270 [Ekhidna sp.]
MTDSSNEPTSFDIIIVGLQPWDIGIGSNCKDIAVEWSKTRRILYVNRALDFTSLIKNRKSKQVQNRLKAFRNKSNRLEKVSENIWVLSPKVILPSINFLPAGRWYNFFNRLNNKLLAREINAAAQKLGFAKKVLFNDNDFIRGCYFPKMVANDLSIYYIRDYLTIQNYFKKRATLEHKLMAESDLIFSNSEYLATYARKHNSRSHFIGQGFDQQVFSKTIEEEPADMKGISRPVIGYLGSLLASRLDLSILREVATQLPDYSLVLVGPEDNTFKESDLHSFSNVHFLGRKGPDEIVDYITHFDVCINPQIVNDLTIGNYPRKVDEYLILGKPVVAVETEAMNFFKEVVFLAKSPQQFVDFVKKALNEDSEAAAEKRKSVASSHSWSNCVAKMEALIKEQLIGK